MKNIKRILVLVLCFALGAFCLASCGETPNADNTSYSVTVTLPDGSGAAGVKVTWSKDGRDYQATTDENGVAALSLPSGNYEISLGMIPDGMTYSPAQTSASAPKVTIALRTDEILYTVTVLAPDGSPVQGIFLQLCVSGDSGSCTPFSDRTDENGKTSRNMPPQNYHVKLLDGVPENLTYAQDDSGYYTGAEATPQSPSITVTLIAVS